MPPKTLFVPKEFSNELTDLIETNPTVERVLSHNLLSQTCRNEGQKFLNFFYNPEELEKKNAKLPNLDHLIDLALDKDAVVDVPEDSSNSIGQINRNASNVLSGPSKRLRDLAMKDPQRRIFRKLRGFIKTKSAKNTMFAGHFQRIFENYLTAYDSEFKPQSDEFYKDDFSMKDLIDFMIKHIKILAYRDFLTHFITMFSKSFPADSNYALEEILSKAGRYLFAIQDMKVEVKNQSKKSKDDQVAENTEINLNSTNNVSNSENNNNTSVKNRIIHSEKFKEFCIYEEGIQPISIEEKRLPLPIYMNIDPNKKVPPFMKLYTEYQNYLEDIQLSNPMKRSIQRPPIPSKKPPLPTSSSPTQVNSSNNAKRASVGPDFFKKNYENANKKRSNTNSYKIPGLLSLEELDSKKRSKQRETQSNVDIISRSPSRKQTIGNRRSVNLSKVDITPQIETNGNFSDGETEQKYRQRSHSMKVKPKHPKMKGKDDRKGKRSSDNEGFTYNDDFNLEENDSINNIKESNGPIVFHYNPTNRRFSSLNDFETTMKEFVHYDDNYKEKVKNKRKKKKFSHDSAQRKVFFLISLIRNALTEDTDFYISFRKNEALLQLLLICGTFCDDDSRLSSEVFSIVRAIIDGDGKDDDEDLTVAADTNDNDHKDFASNDSDANGNNDSPAKDGGGLNDTENDQSDSEKRYSEKKGWQVPEFFADFAEYFIFDPFNVTQKMIAAFQIFWNYRSLKYDVYDTYCYSKYICQNNREKNATSPNSSESNLFLQKTEQDLVLDYPNFEGRIYRKPPGKTPLEVMTPVFFTEPPLSDTFNHHVRRILNTLGKKRQRLAGKDITKSGHIEEILQIDIIYIEFMRNTFDLSLTDTNFQRLHVINAVEKMLELYPCNNKYWQSHNTIARPMLNGHIEKLSKWSMKYDFLVVGKNKELSNIAFVLPGPRAATAANYAQTTFDIDNLISRFKNKLFKIDLGWPSSESSEEEEDYGPVSELDF